MLLRLFGTKCAPSVRILILIAVGVIAGAQVYAQVAGATLTGTVKDSSGGFIPNAQANITDVATGVARTVSTDSAGIAFAATTCIPSFPNPVCNSSKNLSGREVALFIDF